MKSFIVFATEVLCIKCLSLGKCKHFLEFKSSETKINLTLNAFNFSNRSIMSYAFLVVANLAYLEVQIYHLKNVLLP